MTSSTEVRTASALMPEERRFSSIVRISVSESRRRTSACNSRRSGAGGGHAGGRRSAQKEAISEASYNAGRYTELMR